MVPFEHPGLRRARLVKNARLESVIELFSGEGMGSGQIGIRDVAREFEWSNGGEKRDLDTLHKLAELPSFDVYSLRISLRERDITVNDHDDLKLSEAKKQELGIYMQEFTRQLVLQIYGEDEEINDYKDVLALFSHPCQSQPKIAHFCQSKIAHFGLGFVPPDAVLGVSDLM